MRWASRGSVAASADYTDASIAAPVTLIVTCTGDISGDSAVLHVNGSVAATSATDQGTGNYGNYTLYIGRRNLVSFPFNGRLYGLIIRGATSDTTQIASTEAWVNSKTGAY